MSPQMMILMALVMAMVAYWRQVLAAIAVGAMGLMVIGVYQVVHLLGLM